MVEDEKELILIGKKMRERFKLEAPTKIRNIAGEIGVNGMGERQNICPEYRVFVHFKGCQINAGCVSETLTNDEARAFWDKYHNGEEWAGRIIPHGPIRFITQEAYNHFKSRVLKSFYFDEAGEILKIRKGKG